MALLLQIPVSMDWIYQIVVVIVHKYILYNMY